MSMSLRVRCLVNAFSSVNKRKLHFTAAANAIKSNVPDNPPPHVTIDEYIWNHFDEWHDKPAIICADTGRSYLYRDVHNKSNSLANFLHKFPNLPQGSVVALILPNVPEYPVATLACIQAGLKVTTVNPIYTTDEISYQLRDSEAKFVFTLTEFHPKVQKAIDDLKRDIKVVVINHDNQLPTPSGAIKFDEAVDGNHKLQFKINQDPNDVVFIPYSSGTTGLPKGVALTHKNIISTLHNTRVGGIKLHLDTTSDFQDSFPLVLPMFHIYGLAVLLTNMSEYGTKIVTLPKFNTETFLDILVKHRPSFVYLVPPLVQLLINHPKFQYDHLSSLKNGLCGAAPLREEDILKLNEKTKNGFCLYQGYGLTETSAMVSHQFPNQIKLGSSGFLMCNTELKVIATDDTGTELGPKKFGEILVRGPQVMKEYHNNAEATRDSLDAEGWLHTGDIGYYDEEGHIYITDRIKDLIKVKGFQVAPAELEAVLRTHPNIADAAVIGVPSSKFGEVPKAFVVPKENSASLPSDIQQFMAEKTASYKQILGGIVVLKEIPKTASGKIMRRSLREL